MDSSTFNKLIELYSQGINSQSLYAQKNLDNDQRKEIENKVTDVECPHCGLESGGGHICAVVVNAGGTITIIRDDKTPIIGIGESTGRGTSIWIECNCDGCSHPYAIRYQFHKGTLLTLIEERPQFRNELNGVFNFDMWRD